MQYDTMVVNSYDGDGIKKVYKTTTKETGHRFRVAVELSFLGYGIFAWTAQLCIANFQKLVIRQGTYHC